jgi:hypothetical protein
MLIYDVFGRHIGVQRQGERWLLFRVDLNERKCSPLRGIIIPDDLPEAEIPAGWAIFFTKRQARAILTSGLWSSVYGQLLFCSTTR